MFSLGKKLLTSSGDYQPLGATVTRSGVNFAIFSEYAKSVTLLIWEKPKSRYPSQVFALEPSTNKTGQIWHIFVHDLKAYARYAYRVDGKNEAGDYFDVNKVLVDPYARAIDDRFYDRRSACVRGNNLTASLRGVVMPETNYNWDGDELPQVPLGKTVIYELHVKGFTRHPSAQVKDAGTFKALQKKLPYLKDLGISTIELMPIQHFDDDIPFSNAKTGEELVNYWGYSPLSYFALHPAYFSGGDNTAISEFQDFVKAAHQLDLEVIVDVVYNHTTESGLGGPTLNFRGFDNRNYYLTAPGDKRYYQDYTGCGNTLNTNNTIVSKLILDSLAYLATTFHLDGFRFDLGVIFYYSQESCFIDQPKLIKLINDHPVLGRLKLIAEPWDASGNIMEGRFGGPQWLEWNGSYKGRLRKYVNFGEDEDLVSEHLNGFAPEFMAYNKDPNLSVNYVTAHDGFTLRDLVSYDQKHNWENSFENQDGANDNYSHNGGVEGETDDENIKAARLERAQAMLELLFATPGVPMLNMGDEMWRTQGGNNNPFCQDNSITWLNWELLGENQDFYQFVKDLIKKYKG